MQIVRLSKLMFFFRDFKWSKYINQNTHIQCTMEMKDEWSNKTYRITWAQKVVDYLYYISTGFFFKQIHMGISQLQFQFYTGYMYIGIAIVQYTFDIAQG